MPPKSVKEAVEVFVASLYPHSKVAIARRTSLQAAWMAVQDNQLTLAEACATVITSENCTSSFNEWCAAHDLLMRAIEYGSIPRSLDYNGNIAHWHSVIYRFCAKHSFGRQSIEFVKQIFKQSEDAGVIGEGGVDILVNTIDIRNDIEKDNRFVVHAIYQLFVRQAETDVRLREILHYQQVQQMTALVNAIVGLCIPVGGSALTNVISGSAAIIKDFEVCGLVESLLGIANDASNGFGGGRLLDRFLRRTNNLLSI